MNEQNNNDSIVPAGQGEQARSAVDWLGKLDAGRRGGGCVQARRSEAAGRFVYFKSDDIRRILIAYVDEVAGRIEVEVPRRAPLGRDRSDHSQLESCLVDGADQDVVIATIGCVQVLSRCVHQHLAGAADSFESGGQGTQILLHGDEVAVAVPKIGVERVGEFVDGVYEPAIRVPCQMARSGSGRRRSAAHLGQFSRSCVE